MFLATMAVCLCGVHRGIATGRGGSRTICKIGGEIAISKKSGTESGTLPDDLAAIIGAWPTLPDHVKQTIATLIAASR
jgi:hypothetical protein